MPRLKLEAETTLLLRKGSFYNDAQPAGDEIAQIELPFPCLEKVGGCSME
jgi:hypothetical protein